MNSHFERAHGHRSRGGPVRWLAAIIAFLIPIAIGGACVALIGRAHDLFADRTLPTLTAWVFEHPWLVTMLFLPAALFGAAAAAGFSRMARWYVLYMTFLALPLLPIVLAFLWLVVSIYATEIEQAM